MKRTAEGVYIEAPEGEVYLVPTRNGIEARYGRGPLVNGSATDYAERIKQVALSYARKVKLPWTTDARGTARIRDPQLYYEQTFDPNIQAVEALLRWESTSTTRN